MPRFTLSFSSSTSGTPPLLPRQWAVQYIYKEVIVQWEVQYIYMEVIVQWAVQYIYMEVIVQWVVQYIYMEVIVRWDPHNCIRIERRQLKF